ncbi:MAG: hypothetical protein ACI9R7_002311, partial [Lysobacterales bacterium]
ESNEATCFRQSWSVDSGQSPQTQDECIEAALFYLFIWINR